ncbi:sensor histidine kinase [Zunongwangia sp. F363]|uniref:Sensor histidine kinase n=1 Tax=Autumnicola tepida TaxID=3075595 RepID=A0ABU3C791_9FLAO|nr:sensor histidine kinase [Zunongwangia sp. F363]MDT0642216.1 sensor histidine kinase [Zunongwangia sp. F363]
MENVNGKNEIFYNYLENKVSLSYFLETQSIEKINSIKNDSLKRSVIYKISYDYYLNKDSVNFRTWNRRIVRISHQQMDSAKIAEAFWDLASFYYEHDRIDSAYYYYSESEKLYSFLNKDLLQGKMLLNMAIMQTKVKDYIGGEVNTANALRLLKPLGKSNLLYSAYNNLGIIFNELEDYNKSLQYHKKALEYVKELEDPIKEANALNNIGVVYENQAQYSAAIKKFEEALTTGNLLEKNPRLYAMLLDNLGYTHFKNGNPQNSEELLLHSLRVRDSIHHTAGLVINNLHYAEYLSSTKDTVNAYIHANEALSLAKSSKSYGDILSALLLLSEIDAENGKSYLEEYIDLSDSLQKEERSIRNKFARIRFETDEFIEENENLTAERKWIIAGASGFFLIAILLYIIRDQKAKNKELQLQRVQQAANEEIYNLLLTSQDKVEQAKNEAKSRISAELHDGILSKFFGIRLSLEMLQDKEDPESKSKRKEFIKEMKAVENDIREVSHKLNSAKFESGVSFVQILHELWEEKQKLGNFKGELILGDDINWDEIANKVKIHVYRILQESLSNIIKYAQASNVFISFSIADKSLEMEVVDDGCGFDTEKSAKGIGLSNMQSRAKDLGGKLKVNSGEEGTKIELEIPLT